MKIAIDLDGTALCYREFFKELMIAMQERGHEVGILTAINCKAKEETIDMILALGFPEPDFYICKTDAEKEELKPTEGNNGIWKARMVKQHDIDLLFDDLDGNDTYVRYFRNEYPDRLFRTYGQSKDL